ncbi:MAG: C40 family peptidase [Verrucomicrobiota bacterium]
MTTKRARALLAAGCGLALAAGCSSPRDHAENYTETNAVSPAVQAAQAALQSVKAKFAPDSHLAIFNLKAAEEGRSIIVEGDVESSAAKEEAIAAVARTGRNVVDRVTVLPAANLGDRIWGIAALSVINVREKPGNTSEMGTQMLMGDVFKVWKKQTNWFLVQSGDRYLGWAEGGGFVTCAREEVNHWNSSPLLIVTAFEERILEQPDPAALPVADVVMGGRVRRAGETDGWWKVELADDRAGWLPKTAATDYAEWRRSRRATPENIERTAKSFLGRPYFWGCNSIRGMDCSGFTKMVFFLNGIELNRNASEQCRQGVEVALDADLKNLKKGDLLFFGRRATRRGPERIGHAGIYLGDKLFIHSSESVHLSSLDPASPLRDEPRIRLLLHARRLLPDS